MTGGAAHLARVPLAGCCHFSGERESASVLIVALSHTLTHLLIRSGCFKAGVQLALPCALALLRYGLCSINHGGYNGAKRETGGRVLKHIAFTVYCWRLSARCNKNLGLLIV